MTKLPLVSDIVAKIEIVAHFFPGIKHNYDIKLATILLPTITVHITELKSFSDTEFPVCIVSFTIFVNSSISVALRTFRIVNTFATLL